MIGKNPLKRRIAQLAKQKTDFIPFLPLIARQNATGEWMAIFAVHDKINNSVLFIFGRQHLGPLAYS